MIAAWTLLALAAVSADPRARLEAARSRREAERTAAAVAERREGSILSALDAAEKGWARAEQAARVADEQRRAALLRLAEARDAEAADRARVAELRRALGPRLRARARMDATTDLRVLAGGTSLADVVKRRYLWARVAESDLGMLAEAHRVLDRHEAARLAIEREAAEVERLAAAAQEQRAEAAARRNEHRTLLGTVRAERTLHERAAAEAARQEARLSTFVGALPAPGLGAPLHTGFAQLRGKLPLPVSGTVAVGYGPVVNPRFNTVTVQRGVDLRATAGATVRAVAAGRVAHAGWFKGYGNLVIVDHGDGYHTLVAHLASLGTAVGEEVQAGSPLGTVGDSGSLRGPYLYFEIRERGRSVDPREWLRP